MRFCTSELKTAVMCRALVERYPDQTIVSVAGIRRQESARRAKTPVCAVQPKLSSATFQTQGVCWHPILGWSLEDVLAYHCARGFALHEAYTTYGMSRVSCAYCILAGLDDLAASATNPENHDIYREMVELELVSSFSFQEGRWLADVAPHLLSTEQLTRLREAKRRSTLREQVEARIPAHLLYTRGWPQVLPTRTEATLLAEVRRNVAELLGIAIGYSEPEAILERYATLMTLRAARPKKAGFSGIRVESPSFQNCRANVEFSFKKERIEI